MHPPKEDEKLCDRCFHIHTEKEQFCWQCQEDMRRSEIEPRLDSDDDGYPD